ncbi:hypothetical protein PTTW11_06728 [Pyrenophora teres f. teres]|uniref:Uncharacterized protein n=1 Tax=Pyrenophora teres f. teres TaxID=97479 RepID=A0A6S6W4U1_9PLEO|nr:hypothetical protein PTTW11_06728 [Pyrenophora teres f. teres]
MLLKQYLLPLTLGLGLVEASCISFVRSISNSPFNVCERQIVNGIAIREYTGFIPISAARIWCSNQGKVFSFDRTQVVKTCYRGKFPNSWQVDLRIFCCAP